MTNQALVSILRQINLDECDEIIKGEVYYIKKNVRLKCFNCEKNKITSINDLYEFIVLVDSRKIVGGIFIMRGYDLHWYIFKEYRNHHYLSNALRKGVLDIICPDTKEITCHDDEELRCKYLAEIAGLKIVKRR